ncbi:MAG: hypothetical protein AB7G39_16665 [Alphaproteobacteria bacterium]
MSEALSHLGVSHLPEFLEALDGIVYLVAADGTILATNRRLWNAFAHSGGAPGLTPEFVRGRSLFAMIAGDEVRSIARRMHDAALTTHRQGNISYTFRCDAPDVERRMRISASALSIEGSDLGVLYQSTLLSEAVRAPISLFEPATMDAYFDHERVKQIVTLCSYCHAVAWPPDATAKDRDWIDPTDYYRRGGLSDVRVSHGICPSCYETVVARELDRNEDR